MRKCDIRIEIEDGEVKRIMDKLTAAQETIYECYNELIAMGVVTVKEKAASGN